ncbi:MAG: hypothetical protein V1789_12010 [PVC group bacterium]
MLEELMVKPDAYDIVVLSDSNGEEIITLGLLVPIDLKDIRQELMG